MSAQPLPVFEPRFVPTEPARWRWSAQAYVRAVEEGIFGEEPRCELLDGEVYLQVSPQNDPHAVGIVLVGEWLREVVGPVRHVREEKPLFLDDRSVPEPDVLVARGKPRDFVQGHPRPEHVDLVVEVSDTTLKRDRSLKALLYAHAAITEYWILNLPDRLLEVHRDPIQGSDGIWRYGTVASHRPDDTVPPLFAPERAIRVADLLPWPEATLGDTPSGEG